MASLVLLLSAFASVAHAAFVTTNLNVETICRDELTTLVPLPPETRNQITRVAWPIQGPPFQTLPIVNEVGPSGPAEVVCMAGCDDPPCMPPTLCDPGSLWWSVPYTNLIVDSERLFFGPEPIYPPAVGFFYEPYVVPSPSPSPSTFPTMTPSPGVSASTAAAPAATRVAVSCDVCDRSAVVGLAIVLAFIAAGSCGMACWGRRLYHTIRCPYCETKIPRNALCVHLHKCKAHLKMFDPVVLDKVTIVNDPPKNIIATAEKEDAVAQPEATPLRS